MRQEQQYRNIGNKNKKGNKDNKPEAPLISVIVPIYNVERYVWTCLNSLAQQTMKQIEVICIDDGSTDESGKIADEFEKKDENFRVIHTENRGLSAARNRGIDGAIADWLMFVDSDDWVSEEFCRIPYEAAIENQADMVIFDHYISQEKGKLRRAKTGRIQSGIVTEASVIRNCGAWNKLYKRNLFDGIRYPEGYVYEDLATTHRIIHKAERIYQCEEKLYYYRERRGSITKSSSNRVDAYAAMLQQYNGLAELGYITKEDKIFLQEASLDYCGRAGRTDEPLYQTAVEIVEEINEKPDGFDIKHRLKLLMWRANRNAYRELYRACGKQIKRV